MKVTVEAYTFSIRYRDINVSIHSSMSLNVIVFHQYIRRLYNDYHAVTINQQSENTTGWTYPSST